MKRFTHRKLVLAGLTALLSSAAAFATMSCASATMSIASAQDTRSSLSVDALTPGALERIRADVIAPDAPVRLLYAEAGQTAPSVRIDVRLAPSVAAARTTFDQTRRSIAGAIDAAAVGDAGFGDTDYAFFLRDNVFVAVRRLRSGIDAMTLARAIDEAIRRAPIGPVAPATIRAEVPRLQVGEAGTVRLAGDVLGSDIRAVGGAFARRTPTGWELVRRSEAPVQVRVLAVDSELRLFASEL